VKITVEALCRRDANLLKCEAALEFMMRKLNDVNTELGHNMRNALQNQIMKRRTEISGVLRYLHYGSQAHDNDLGNLFSVPTLANIKMFAKEILSRIHCNTSKTFEAVDMEEEQASSASRSRSIDDDLHTERTAGSECFEWFTIFR
jgi:hypothetical protein